MSWCGRRRTPLMGPECHGTGARQPPPTRRLGLRAARSPSATAVNSALNVAARAWNASSSHRDSRSGPVLRFAHFARQF